MPEKRGSEHLYSEESKRKFEEEYGKDKGDRVFGATVGKVASEQARNRGRDKVERVEAHESTSPRGRRFRVQAHEAHVGPSEAEHLERVPVEIPGHVSFSRGGKREEVRPHTAEIWETHSHARGHHSGPCSGACRRGRTPHRHKYKRR